MVTLYIQHIHSAYRCPRYFVCNFDSHSHPDVFLSLSPILGFKEFCSLPKTGIWTWMSLTSCLVLVSTNPCYLLASLGKELSVWWYSRKSQHGNILCVSRPPGWEPFMECLLLGAHHCVPSRCDIRGWHQGLTSWAPHSTPTPLYPGCKSEGNLQTYKHLPLPNTLVPEDRWVFSLSAA